MERIRGFTLVELLIVVIILAILAAIVVPQFASSTDDAKLSGLDTTLANMRSAIDLYYQQHGEYPGEKTAVSGADCTATKGTGAGGAGAGGVDAFKSQMSLYTDTEGLACSKKMAGYVLGPYLKKAELPPDPFENDNTLVVVADGDLGMTADATDGGWKYDVLAGKFIMNHTSYDDR